MRSVFVSAYLDQSVKKSGDLTLTGYVCPFCRVVYGFEEYGAWKLVAFVTDKSR
ncbi:hypothetical protein [Paenibacillus lactis]|uniref:hypothetical protein n=1 Tax=Paenibacillus lactis TaxID=228574 RepID=UPI00164265C7